MTDAKSSPAEAKGPNDKGHENKIRIDRIEYKVHEDHLSGAQLRKLPDPDIGPDRDLFEVVPGNPDHKVELTEQVQIRNGQRFFTAPAHINPGSEQA